MLTDSFQKSPSLRIAHARPEGNRAHEAEAVTAHSEPEPTRKTFLLQLSRLVERQLVAALDLLGIEAPEKM